MSASSKHSLCKTDDLTVGEMRQVNVEGVGDVCVYYTAEGFFATEDSRTHAVAALVDGYIDGNLIYCPYHGGAFEISTGKAVLETCAEPLRTFRVSVEGDDVLLGG